MILIEMIAMATLRTEGRHVKVIGHTQCARGLQ